MVLMGDCAVQVGIPNWAMPTKRVAIYCRVSTRDKGQDTANQAIQLRAYCARQGWEIVEEYTDQGSAKNGERSAFKRLFDDASKRRFDVVLVWALDRLTRAGVYETFDYVRRLTSYGVQFESYTEAHFRTTGPAGELMLAVAAWIAQQERLRLSERTKAGLQRAKRQGQVLGRRRVNVDPSRVTELRAAGKSFSEIATALRVSRSVAYRAAVAS
jgi:DNA invertase Pin-like site-specific DNA recombinase